MNYKKTENEIIFEQNNSVGRRVGISNNTEFVKLVIGAGEVIPSHSLDLPVTFYIISGSGKVNIGSEKITAVKGDLIEIPSGADREWENTSDDILKLLVLKYITQEK